MTPISMTNPELAPVRSNPAPFVDSPERVAEWMEIYPRPQLLLDAETGSVLDVNRSTTKLFGARGKAWFIGAGTESLSPECQPSGVKSAVLITSILDTAAETGQHCFSWVFQSVAGDPIHTDISLQQLMFSNRRAYLCVLHDETERHQVEKSLREALERKESATRARSQFSVSVSETVKLPLHNLLSTARGLLTTNLSTEQRKSTEKISTLGQGLLSTLNRVSDLVRIEAGEMKLDSTPFDLRVATEDVVDLLAPKADRKGLNLVLDYSVDLPRRGMGDSGRFRQILISLLENAIAFTESGDVELGLSGVPQQGNRLLIEGFVRDTGVGIPRDQLSNLLGANHGATPSAEPQRVGLGFAIAKSLIRLMRGKVEISSSSGLGTKVSFSFYLGLDESIWPFSTPPEKLQGKRVMVLEKSDLVRSSLIAVLDHWGFTAIGVSHPTQALELLKSLTVQGQAIWSIFVSTEIEGMDWETFGKQCVELAPNAEPIRVLMGRSTNLPTQAEAKAAGYANVISRNVRQHKLLSLLTELAGEGRTSQALRPSNSRNNRQSRFVLVAEQNEVDRNKLQNVLDEFRCSYDLVNSSEDVFERVSSGIYDAVLIGPSFLGKSAEISQVAEHCSLKGTSLMRVLPEGAEPPFEAEDDVSRSRALNISINALKKTLNTLASRQQQTLPPSFDQEKVLGLCGGDFQMFATLATEFREEIPRLLNALIEASGREDTAGVQRIGAELRATAQFLSAAPLENAASRLEKTAELLDWGAVPSAISALRLEFSRLTSQLPAQGTVSES